MMVMRGGQESDQLARGLKRSPIWDYLLAVAGLACTAMLAAGVLDGPAPGWIGWGYVTVNALLCVCLAARNRCRRVTWAVSYSLLAIMAVLVYLSPVNLGVSPLIATAPLVLFTVARHEHPAWGAAALLLGVAGALANPAQRMPGGGGGMVALAILVMVATYLWASSLRRSDEEHVQTLNQVQAEASQRVALAEAAERERIASEVHDSVGHSLTVVIVQANSALALNDPARIQQTLEHVRDSAKRAMAELRELVTDLRADDPTYVTGALTELESLVQNARAAGLDLSETLPDHAALEHAQREWPVLTRLAVVRIVQESLTNALKHAAIPANARLEVVTQTGTCRVTMSNRAVTADGPVTAGNGLLGLQERARRAGGAYQAEHSGGLFRICACLPTDPDTAVRS